MNERGGVIGFFDKHLFTLVIGAALVYSNVQSAEATSTVNIDGLKGRIERLEAKIDRLYELGLSK
jgi:hypothetical protein